MIQFNLLPDVKLEYLRAKKLKALLTTISIIVSTVSLGIALVLLFTVSFLQKNNMKDLEKDITTASQTVQATPDITRILTVQNQLQSLSAVHNIKPAVTRLFDYIAQVTPADVTISGAKIEFTGNTIALTGGAPDLLSINRYVDTLKFTTYTAAEEDTEATEEAAAAGTPAFTQVVLAGFASDKAESTYQINMTFDPELFNNQKQVKMTVPSRITTRSQQQAMEKQTDVLFKKNTSAGEGSYE